MRRLLILLSLLPCVAVAQVTTDDHALDSLPASKPAVAQHAAKPAIPSARPGHKAAHAPARTHAAAKPHAPVTMPTVAPANPVIAPPPFVMPAHAPPPPPPVPVRADAPGAASAIAGGTRISFGAGTADLNPATLAAIKLVAVRAAANPTLTIAVTAWAPGVADDPSTPRRLSLDRALAVRAVLINAGIVSERIRTVARGMADLAGGPADRADVLELPPGK